MIEIASQIIINLIIATLLGAAIGYLLATNIKNIKFPSKGKKEEQTKNKTNSSINPIFKKSSKLDNKPLVLSSPRSSGKDNLLKIKGIDAKIQKDLNQLGIYHFDQISNWTVKNCDWVEAFLLLPGCAKDNQWVEQARILETGKETIYSQKIDDLSNS